MTDPLDTFRRAAKILKSTYEAGDLNARARINAQLPRSRFDLKHADLLLSHGADVNTGALSGGQTLSPLYWALGHAENMPLAKWLLENGANPNDGESLYHAAELGHTKGVELLLSFGADPKHTNVLPRALDFGNFEMVEILLKAGADPNAGTDIWREKNPRHQGVPALHHAARRMNSGGVVDVVLDHGVALPHKTIEMAVDDSIRAFLRDWAKAKPGQVVAHGIG